MAGNKSPYDPVKTVKGMFMGSVARMAYAMRDPSNYAQSTKAVLFETAKKFQDALDDCDIQILDAKWHLEHQLAQNKARREAKAKEENAVNVKRKLEDVKDVQDKTAPNNDNETARLKRVKTDEPEDSTQQTQSKPKQPSPKSKPTAQPAVSAPVKPETQPAAPALKDKPAKVKPPEKPKVSVPTNTKATQQKEKELPVPKPPEAVRPPARTMTQTSTDEFPKPTPQDTPAESESFNFESMFGEPSAEIMEEDGNNMSFDLDNLGGDGFGGDASNMNNIPDTSLNSLLPGLESYAHQAGDDAGFNMSGISINGLSSGMDASGGGVGLINPQQQSQQDFQSQQTQSSNPNDFSLPQLGPNEFDDFLNANDMNFDETNLNADADALLNMENLENMDLDSMFN